MSYTVTLREIIPSDLPHFFEYQRDPEAYYMAAFTPRDPNDRATFDSHWARIMADDTVINRTILVDGVVVGSVVSFMMFGEREVGYGIDKAYWGQGITTAALRLFLDTVVSERPLHAHAAKDNVGSIRVLQKCGFVITGYMTSYAEARGKEIEEAVLVLEP
ncbi:MAG: GNAT family N-acetyltransferase [Chloroflexi bacterium]|nr:GNAT family N-acetyltransferase [Chloroflexota bacterium]MCC6896232.1 GNAT family N-acetyltransferase [Anaerolineae bacterium]